ncbi:MAG: excalibur calcium-binding domain-containing protein [Microvirga sp.]|nr:excalibur calcium-binding domain-containing protein [Microvirga sp.]
MEIADTLAEMAGFSSPRRDPEREAEKLKRRFGVVTRRFERGDRLRCLKRILTRPAVVIGFVVGAAGAGVFALSPWPASVTLKHVVAMAGCSTAGAVGLGRSRPGEPGYWFWLDRDRDGVACEWR